MISVSNMSFGYKKSNLFNGLNLAMDKGNIYGLLGLNGAGKTTLIKLLTGLLFPKEGKIRVMDEEPSRRTPGFLSNVFVVPEELNIPSISQREFILSNAPFYLKFDRRQFDHYLSEFDVPENKKLNTLSLGQKKKFLLSFGLACNSALLVLDEPTNGLDIPSKGLFRRLIAESITNERIFIISTHQVKDVDSLIDPITILHEGKIIFEHSVAEVSEKLYMTRSSSPPEAGAQGLMYSEAVGGGYWEVWEGTDSNGGGPIDLEILFNTIISRPEVYHQLFSEQEKEESRKDM